MSKVVSTRYYEQLDVSLKVEYRDFLLTTPLKDIFFVPLSLATSYIKEDYRVAGSKEKQGKQKNSEGSSPPDSVLSHKCLCSFSFADYIVVCLCFPKLDSTWLFIYVSRSDIFSSFRGVLEEFKLTDAMFSRCISVGSSPSVSYGLKYFVLDPDTVYVVVWVDDSIIFFKVCHEEYSILIEKQFNFSFGSSLRDISISGLYNPWFAAVCMNGLIYYGKLLDPVSESKYFRVKGLSAAQRKQLHFIHFCCRPFAAIVLSDNGKMYMLDILKDKMEELWVLPSLDESVVDRFISIRSSKSNPFEFHILTRFHIHTFDERQLHHPIMSISHFLMSYRPVCLDVCHRNGNELLVVGCEIESCVRLFVTPQLYDKWKFPYLSEPNCVHLHMQSLLSVPENMKGFELYHSYRIAFPFHCKDDISIGDAVFVHSTDTSNHQLLLLSFRDEFLYFCLVDVDNLSDQMECQWRPVGKLCSSDEDQHSSENNSEQTSTYLLRKGISEWKESSFVHAVTQLFQRLFNSHEHKKNPSISSEWINSHLIFKILKQVKFQVPHLSTELLSDVIEKLPSFLESQVDYETQIWTERFMDKRKHLVGSLLDRNAIDRVKECMDEYMVSAQDFETIPVEESTFHPSVHVKHYVVNAKTNIQVDKEFAISDDVKRIVDDVWNSYFS